MIDPLWERELHNYMGAILHEYQSHAIAINSVPDHIHILFLLSKNHALASVVQKLKQNSSIWIGKSKGLHGFKWQKGYGAFSVSQSKLETVKRYIHRQKEHHNKVSLEAEISKLCLAYQAPNFNPDYYWRDDQPKLG
ncbi:transposase [Fulvitalea axinellae]|uniref:Transposase n=2 Tax=Fulvitalea axinellae TaxID=1182444 RepID=A0AAU9CM31_9BACT|nr:transposase [Fulvitalea axinellae]